MLEKEDEEKEEPMEEDTLDISTAKEHVAALQKLMGNAIPTELMKNLEKSVEDASKEDVKLTPQLIFKVTKCQKALEKAQAHLTALDNEWEVFQRSMKDRIAEQKRGYIINRATAQESYKEKLKALGEAQMELKQRAAGASIPTEMALLSDDQFKEMANNTELEDQMRIDLTPEVDEEVKAKVGAALAAFRAPKRKSESPDNGRAKDAKKENSQA